MLERLPGRRDDPAQAELRQLRAALAAAPGDAELAARVARLATHNPNGAIDHIAGLRSERGNVCGLMPHPEHAVDPDVGPTGGQVLFESILAHALETVG